MRRPIFINRDIRAAKVRTISEDGDQIGILPLDEAISLAKEKGKDLVCVAPQAIPPVCRILDYGKYRYEMSKKEKQGKVKHHTSKLKEVKIKARIEEHDYQVKLRRAKKFLERGDKLRLTLIFRGREMIRQEHGRQILSRMIEDLKEYGTLEHQPKMSGRRVGVVLSPTNRER